MALFTVTGPTSVEEGTNITLTVSRQGDLSQSATLLASTVAWGNYSPALQMVNASDQEQFSSRYVTFDPGQARQTVSYQVYSDGETEGWEYSFVSFAPIVDYGGGRYTYNNADSVNTNLGSKIWGTKVYDPGTLTPQPTVTQTTPLATQTVTSTPTPTASTLLPTPTPVVPPITTNVNVDNSVSYTDNSVVNNYVNSFNTDNSITSVTDNSVNDSFNTDNSVNDSFNTDNSVRTYSLSYVTSVNDYSIDNSINGSGRVTGTEENDLLTGGKRKDRIYGDLGNDELIGGAGKDRLYGGVGSNVFNAGTSSSKKDADRLYIQREGNAVTADIIETIGKSDRIYIQGATGDLSVKGVDGGLGIYDNDVLQAIYTGNNFNASRLDNMLVAA